MRTRTHLDKITVALAVAAFAAAPAALAAPADGRSPDTRDAALTRTATAILAPHRRRSTDDPLTRATQPSPHRRHWPRPLTDDPLTRATQPSP